MASRSRAPLAVVLACCCVAALPSLRVEAEPAPQLPDPGDLDSHEGFAKLLDESRAVAFRRILAAYDRHVAANEDDYVAALERCRFLTGVRNGEEFGEVEWLAAQSGDCSKELAERYPNVVPVLQFRIEQLAPEPAISFGEAVIKKPTIAWSKPQRASFLKSLALAYDAVGKTPQAIWAARTAQSLDREVDVAVIVANDLKSAGSRSAAVRELTRSGVGDTSVASQKLDLLIELEAYPQALTLIDALANAGVTVQPLVQARALASAGKTDAARAKLAEAGTTAANRIDVLRRIFRAELARKNRARAISAYDALRAEGFVADPLARDRLGLAWAFPSAPWHARDLLGLLALVALALSVVLLPAIVVLPVHYFGLVLGRRGTLPTFALGRWSLRQLWAVLASVTLAQLTALYVIDGDLLVAFLRAGSFEVPATHNRHELARVLLGTSLIGLCATAIWLRRGDYARLVRCSWSPRQIAIYVTSCLAAVYAVHGASVAIERMLGHPAAAMPKTGTVFTVEDGLRDVLHDYGALALFVLTVVVAPIAEELVFRSVWLGSASRHVPFVAANLMQAGAFMLAHDTPARYPTLLALALLAGWLTRRSDGLAPALWLHASVNFVAVCALCFGATRNPRGTPPEPPSNLKWQSAAELQHACDRGDGGACLDLSTRYAKGDLDVRKNHATATRLTERACDAGIALSCYELARAEPTTQADEPALARAATLYRKACEVDRALGCYELADAYEHGTGVAKDPAAALRLYKQSCDRGRAEACRQLAVQYDHGVAVPFDPELAAHFYQRACGGGDALGCLTLGGRYERGESVERDLLRAAALYRAACRGHVTSGCYNLGRLYQFGIGVTQDNDRAAGLYKLACEHKGDPACLSLRYLPMAER